MTACVHPGDSTVRGQAVLVVKGKSLNVRSIKAAIFCQETIRMKIDMTEGNSADKDFYKSLDNNGPAAAAGGGGRSKRNSKTEASMSQVVGSNTIFTDAQVLLGSQKGAGIGGLGGKSYR